MDTRVCRHGVTQRVLSDTVRPSGLRVIKVDSDCKECIAEVTQSVEDYEAKWLDEQ
jgi:hypothetical protein